MGPYSAGAEQAAGAHSARPRHAIEAPPTPRKTKKPLEFQRFLMERTTGVEPYLADAEKPLIIARIQATEKQSRRKVLELPYSKTLRRFLLVSRFKARR